MNIRKAWFFMGGGGFPNPQENTTEVFHMGGDNNDEDGIFITSM